MRIRHFGFLANRSKKQMLPQCRKLLDLALPQSPILCTAAIAENLPALLSTFTHSVFYHYQIVPFCTAALLYNPHCRNGTVAPRFSPTRFIPPSLLYRSLLGFDCFQPLAIKRYSLDR